MKFITKKSKINGEIIVPGSKSHTIRAFYFAMLADGKSRIKSPLMSSDALSSITVSKAFGAKIIDKKNLFEVDGVNGKPIIPENVIDVGNSGTTINIGLSVAALVDGYTVFTGDHQIRNRPVAPLQAALNNLGASVNTTRNNGNPPVIVKGRAKGGTTHLDGISSQYLTSLLVSCPLLDNDTTVIMDRLFEIPYVDITLWWLNKLGIKVENDNYTSFYIPGRQNYRCFEETIPGDFSSATFFIALGAIPGNRVKLRNLDMSDPQGDKLVLKIVESMGAKVIYNNDSIEIIGDELTGLEIDMNSIPDALPAISALACLCEGTTTIRNVKNARLKETDRIKVMHDELSKLGADIKEIEDGLIIKKSKLNGGIVNGYHDHRIVMAMSIIGQTISEELTIETAEAVNVTFPDFAEFLKNAGGNIVIID